MKIQIMMNKINKEILLKAQNFKVLSIEKINNGKYIMIFDYHGSDVEEILQILSISDIENIDNNENNIDSNEDNMSRGEFYF